jgi:hypothetical protein
MLSHQLDESGVLLRAPRPLDSISTVLLLEYTHHFHTTNPLWISEIDLLRGFDCFHEIIILASVSLMMRGVVGVNRKTAASHNDLLVSVIFIGFYFIMCVHGLEINGGFEL